MYTPNSPDISNLLVKVTWDLSQKQPVIYFENQSTGNNLNNVSYGFLIKSPSQTILHDGNVSEPDITGVWTNFTAYSTQPDPNLSPQPINYIVASWPRPFNQIEWSGAPYTITIYAKDSIGNIFELPVSQMICRPQGNTPISITTYGLGEVNITADCNRGSYFFEDYTNTSYKGIKGVLESSQLKVLYPNDETDTAPQPFIIDNFATALVPVTYDSQNYEYVYNSTIVYDFGNNSFVKIKYYRKQRFAVTCNIDLCPLVCEYEKLLQQAQNANCENQKEINDKLLLINGKLNLAMIAKMQPLCGIDLPALIDEIKTLGGFECDCCSTSGIGQFNSANIGDYNFQIIPGGGDVNGKVDVVGNNIQFTLYDKNYIFKICDDAPTAAFTVTPSTNGYTRTFCLNVNMVELATDILNIVKGNQNLINLFNSIVQTGAGDFKLIVDGGCIFQTTSSCDYTYTLHNIPTNTTYALLMSLSVAGISVPVNFAFNLTNLAALQTFLNTLGYGNFVVTDLGSNNVSIASANNTANLGDLTYKITSTNHIADLLKTCTGFVPVSASDVVQQIISYICNLDDNQLVTSQDYTICYATGNLQGSPPSLVNTLNIVAGTKLNVFLASLLAANCASVSYLATLKYRFYNGVQQVGNDVGLGGFLSGNTTIANNGKYMEFADANSSFKLNPNNTFSFYRQGSGGTDLINVTLTNYELYVNEISTNSDRANIAYYATATIFNKRDAGTGQKALIGINVPTSNDGAFEPPPKDPALTAYVEAFFNESTSTPEVNTYGKKQTNTGSILNFDVLVSAQEMTTTQRSAIDASFLTRNRIIFNTTTNKLQCYVPATSTWNDLF